MKQIITIVLYLLLPISIYSQDYDLKDDYIKGINKSLDSGDCKHAELVYKVAIENKVLKADADIEARIAECKGTANVSQDYVENTMNINMKMVYVEGGTFTMGATEEQRGDADDDEFPTHRVTLDSYYIGACEVTQAQWRAVMGSNPSYFSGDNNPVERVTWNDAKNFCRELSNIKGRTYCLPTEAQWEYAARGGNKSKGYKY